MEKTPGQVVKQMRFSLREMCSERTQGECPAPCGRDTGGACVLDYRPLDIPQHYDPWRKLAIELQFLQHAMTKLESIGRQVSCLEAQFNIWSGACDPAIPSEKPCCPFDECILYGVQNERIEHGVEYRCRVRGQPTPEVKNHEKIKEIRQPILQYES
jgi:hypothetical protein